MPPGALSVCFSDTALRLEVSLELLRSSTPPPTSGHRAPRPRDNNPRQANTVIILFRVLDNTVAGTAHEDGALGAMANLTGQAQDPDSALYSGQVTDRIDPNWGIVAVALDASLKLTTAIEVIGEDSVRDG